MSERILDCDICSSPMTHTKLFDKNVFKCTKCEQTWIITQNTIQRQILKRMYPQKMDPEMHHEFINYKVSEYMFIQLAKLISGLITQKEYDENRQDAIQEAEKAHLAVPKKKSWKFWKKATSESHVSKKP